jgi:hypothetical protein
MDNSPAAHRFRPASAAAALLLLLLLATALAIAGCRDLGFLTPSPAPPPPELTPDQRTIELKIVEGPQGAILPFVPVYINGEGPFSFAVDTGASQTLIDRAVVDRLGLETRGQARPVTGVIGGAHADVVELVDWSMGGAPLPARDLLTLELPRINGEFQWHGLLGSDVLSLYGSITLDYERSILILGTPAEAALQQ